MIITVALLLVLTGCTASEDNTDNTEAVETKEIAAEIEETPEVEQVQADDELRDDIEVVEKVDPSTLPQRSLNGLLLTQDIPEDTTQVILVVVEDSREKMYLMQLHEAGVWQVAYGPFEAEIGRNGLGKQKEGDGKSPVGVFELGYAFGRYGAPAGTTWPWRDTVSGDKWIEDSNSKYYNLFVKEDEIEDKDWKNGSNLNISAYDRAIEVRYNEERTPKLGSAIFIHCWADYETPTSGCTAIAERNMDTLVSWMDPMQHTVLVQVPYDMLSNGDMEYLCDFDYDAAYDIKFAGDDNFFGEVLPGYNANTVIATTEMIEMILEINEYLSACDRQLFIYDGYRPLDAYDYIIDWTLSASDTAYKDDYYPELSKKDLITQHFNIKDLALYPRAQVIHVGLADMDGNEVDMGSEYFAFTDAAGYSYTDLTAEAEYNRELLHDIMVNAGFKASDSNWWEFTLNPDPYDSKYAEVIE